MSKPIIKKPVRILPTDLTKHIAEGVARAHEARSVAGVELSAQEVTSVSGGALADFAYYRAGGIPVNPYIFNQQVASAPTIPTNSFNTKTIG